ncbi:hypothetical protein B4U80_07123 [Leptotrombidium deliense]|uniref:Uncharacterized protein n=1 Tax=Leptotrombidium deliense TaxID=299467 RepID=A0A443SEN6_9ACAR|nr:hypothetical protein B4U80_07123 [Leptotrombidium deliense]
MSTGIEVRESKQSSDEQAGTSTATTEGQSSRTNAEALNLTTLDKIKRFFFSKEEWEAYLLEKLEEQNNRKDSKNEDQNNYNPLEDPTDKQSVVAWIRTVFPSQDDANSFLKLQLEKLQEVKDVKTVEEVNKENASPQSATIAMTATAVPKTVDSKAVEKSK